ncbi:unnamed protein product, partial [Protopolystoma xenopodis]
MDLYRRGLLHSPAAFTDTQTPTQPALEPNPGNENSQESALLHGNLSAGYFHLSLWSACAWHCCLALELRLQGPENVRDRNIELRLNKRLLSAAGKIGFDGPACSSVRPGDAALSDYIKALKQFIYDSTDLTCKSGMLNTYSKSSPPVPRYGRNPT